MVSAIIPAKRTSQHELNAVEPSSSDSNHPSAVNYHHHQNHHQQPSHMNPEYIYYNSSAAAAHLGDVSKSRWFFRGRDVRFPLDSRLAIKQHRQAGRQ